MKKNITRDEIAESINNDFGLSKKFIDLSFNLPLLGNPIVIKLFIYYLN